MSRNWAFLLLFAAFGLIAIPSAGQQYQQHYRQPGGRLSNPAAVGHSRPYQPTRSILERVQHATSDQQPGREHSVLQTEFIQHETRVFRPQEKGNLPRVHFGHPQSQGLPLQTRARRSQIDTSPKQPRFPIRVAQSASQEDPFGEVQDPVKEPQEIPDPFGDAPGQQAPPTENSPPIQDPFGEAPQQPVPQDPFAEPPAQDIPPTQVPQDPSGEAPQQPVPQDPFAEPPAQDIPPSQVPQNPPGEATQQPEPQDPFADVPQPKQDPIDPFAEPPALDSAPMLEPKPQIPDQQQVQPQQAPTTPPTDVVQPQDDPDVFAPPQLDGEEPQIPAQPTQTPRTRKTQPGPPTQIYPGQIPPSPRRSIAQPGNVEWPLPYAVPPQGYSPAIPAPGYFNPGAMAQPAVAPGMAAPYAPPYYPQGGYVPGGYSQEGYAPLEYAPDGYQPYAAVATQPAPDYSGIMPSFGGDCQPSGDCCSPCETFDNVCEPNYYFSLYGGIDNIWNLASAADYPLRETLDFDTGGGFGVALGTIQGYNLRTEFEFSYRSSDLVAATGPNVVFPTTGTLDSYAGMANAYWEFMAWPKPRWKPYIGAGIGFVFVDTKFYNELSTESDSGFAFQGILGLNYKLGYCTDIFAEYRFFASDNINIEGAGIDSKFDYSTNNAFFGVRLKF